MHILSVYDGPATIFPWGNMLERREWHGRLHLMHQRNIGLYCTKGQASYRIFSPLFLPGLAGAGNELITSDPAMVKHVLSDKFDIWAKSAIGGRFFSSVVDWLGTGIFTIDHGKGSEFPKDNGHLWHTQRRTAATIFTRSLFKNFYQEVFQTHTNELITILKEKVGANGDIPVDFQHWMHALTMDCFGKIAFGAPLGNLDGSDTGFGSAFDNAHNQVLLFIATHVKSLMVREALPRWIGDVVQKYLIERPCPVHTELRRNVALLDSYTQRLIDEKQAALNNGHSEATENDLLTLFLRMRASGESGVHLTDVHMRDLIKNFLIAGRDTTACTLSWLFFELGREQNKAVLNTLIAELDATLQGAVPTHDDFQDLPYLRGCIWEVLRLHPVVPAISVTSKEDDVLPDGVNVPRGTRVLIACYTMGRDKKVYGEDADTFKPERWIPFTQPSPYEFPMFKAGRRLCLGKDMALYEMSLVATMLLQNFTPEVVAEENVSFGAKVTMCVKDLSTGLDGLQMYLRPRK